MGNTPTVPASSKASNLPDLYTALMRELLHIRTVSANYILAYYGYFVLIVGYVATKGKHIGIYQGHALLLVTLVIGALSFSASSVLSQKATEISQALCNIEEFWACYQRGAYLQDKTLLPTSWGSLEQNRWRDPEFRFQRGSTLVITLLVAILLVNAMFPL